MPSVCPECGSSLAVSPKFCSECGYKLEQSSKVNRTSERKLGVRSYEYGEKLEEAVERIFQVRGFATSRRKRLKGKSGTINEIDVLAEKGNKKIAVECKNLSSDIGQDHIRNFYVKLDELSIRKGYFASNTDFTSGAKALAQQKNITLWNRDNLMEQIYSMTVGRFEQGHKISFKNALSCKIGLEEASRMELRNKDEIEIECELIYHPYFSVEYSFGANYRDPARKLHNFRDKGVVFIDAVDGRVLNQKGLASKVRKLISKDKGSRSELLKELQLYKKATDYDMFVSRNFNINKMEPEVTHRFTKKLALDFIVDKNSHKIPYSPKSSESLLDVRLTAFKPKRKQIMIRKTSFFYIPKWNISFASKDVDYSREMYAYSGSIIEDTITFCPEHTSLGRFKIVTKRNVGLCEECGQALCEEHVKQCLVCEKWLCLDHGVECEKCNNLFCSNHISVYCSICGRPLCDSCKIQCPICNEYYAKQHQVTCDSCDEDICQSCTASKGLLRKKHYCKNCRVV